MTANPEHRPGDPAPKSGRYRLLNILGGATETHVYVAEGQPLPAAPHGQTWRLEREADDTE
jgi:hypothetical protein